MPVYPKLFPYFLVVGAAIVMLATSSASAQTKLAGDKDDLEADIAFRSVDVEKVNPLGPCATR